jgi:nudix-type nucleoside diphosphatase (YffH/AdpP family)
LSDPLPASRLPAWKLKDRKVVYDGWLTLEVAVFDTEVRGETVTIRREVHDHGHGACVLPFDVARRTAVLVRQVRAAALLESGDGVLIEAVAGLVDAGESSEEAVRREAWEEAGVRLGAVEFLGAPYSSPGSLTERAYLYLGEIDANAPRGSGGGLIEEHEEIEVIEVGLADLARLADAGEIADLKTMFLIEALRRRRPALFV